MPQPENDWACTQLVEFVGTLASCETEDAAIDAAVQQAAEALEAEVAALASATEVLATVGFRAGKTPVTELLSAAHEAPRALDVPGAGLCWTMSAPIEDPEVTALMVGRSGPSNFSYQEATLLRGMGQALVMSLRLLRTVEEERALRAELQDRQSPLERLSRIQTSISRRVPLPEVLDAVVLGAEELLGADLAALRLVDATNPGYQRMVSSSGVKSRLMDSEPPTKISDGVGGRAIAEGRVVVMNDYTSDPNALPSFAADNLSAAMAAPVRENDVVTGSLVVGSYDPTRTYTKAEQDLLMALAEHASMAIMDAKTVEAVRAAEQKLVQVQKMEAIGQLAGGVAHDFNNLLFVIQNCANFLAQSIYESDPRRSDVDEIMDAAERAASLTKQLLTFSRRQVIDPQVLNVNEHVADVEKLLRRTITQNIELTTHLNATDGWTTIDPGQLEQILMNLAVNAKDAMPNGGEVHITTRNAQIGDDFAASRPGLEPGSYVLLEVSDNGPGMSEEIRDRVFEPFFTTKALGDGTGLGLATLYGIVKRVNGHVEVSSPVGYGSTFSIYLPATDERPAAVTPVTEDPTVTVASKSQTILVAEDEPPVRKLVCRQLRNAGYEVIEANTGAEALELFEAASGSIGLLLTDVIMPKLSGKELADRVAASDPTVKIIFMSGYTDDVIASQGVLGEGELFLQKPFSGQELLEKLENALESSPY